MSFEVRRVPPQATYPLRQQVLRPQQTVDQMRLPGDDRPDTGFLAAIDQTGTVIGTGSVRREPCPWQPERQDAWRLRAMATAPGQRGNGVGGQVLAACLSHVEQQGGGLLWCSARITARAFYERGGFTAHGLEWDEPGIGLHVHMWCEVSGPADPAAEEHGPATRPG